MLSNAYFLAKFRFDTAENEPAKKLQQLPILLTLTPWPIGPAGFRRAPRARRRARAALRPRRAARGGGRRHWLKCRVWLGEQLEEDARLVNRGRRAFRRVFFDAPERCFAGVAQASVVFAMPIPIPCFSQV